MAFLAEVVSPNSHTITVKDRKRRGIFDYTFCLLVPLIISALQTLVQPTRYGIVRGQGCASTWTNSWPLYTFYVIWQPIFAFVGCLLSGKSNPSAGSRGSLLISSCASVRDRPAAYPSP